jgi:hypothetical protein
LNSISEGTNRRRGCSVQVACWFGSMTRSWAQARALLGRRTSVGRSHRASRVGRGSGIGSRLARLLLASRVEEGRGGRLGSAPRVARLGVGWRGVARLRALLGGQGWARSSGSAPRRENTRGERERGMEESRLGERIRERRRLPGAAAA